ncbi:hypothetical protein GCHA_4555 [Paraglaciecola chathamensis S18K6]|uniref:Uncharacterized protein n=1 Tax=Paraglaciecola chathamensis S18K6 TaxID=1127672 RepID=A0AAV3V6V9_9ALTE|nr:hypothetical protein GCHA_4555 [Paraglaciecola chathamensis S18K6]
MHLAIDTFGVDTFSHSMLQRTGCAAQAINTYPALIHNKSLRLMLLN